MRQHPILCAFVVATTEILSFEDVSKERLSTTLLKTVSPLSHKSASFRIEQFLEEVLHSKISTCLKMT